MYNLNTNTKGNMLLEGFVDNYVKNLIYSNVPTYITPDMLGAHIDDIKNSNIDVLTKLFSVFLISDEEFKRYLNRDHDRKLWDVIRLVASEKWEIHGKRKGEPPSRFYIGGMRVGFQDFNLLGGHNENLTLPTIQERTKKLKELYNYVNKTDNKNGDNREFEDPEVTALNDEMNKMNGETVNGKNLFERFKPRIIALNQKELTQNLSKIYGDGKGTGKYTKIIITPENSTKTLSSLKNYVNWCIVTSKGMFDSYTTGGARFYIFLREDYKNYSKTGVEGEGCPLDDYGLSMVSVLVNQDGGLEKITTRWNADVNNGEFQGKILLDQNFMNNLQTKLGFNIYKECPPYTKEELKKMGLIPFSDLQKMLDEGTEPNEIFKTMKLIGDGNYIVQANDMYNILTTKENKLISDSWYSSIEEIKPDLFFIEKTAFGQANFSDASLNFLFDEWFDYATEFAEIYFLFVVNKGFKIFDIGKRAILTGYDMYIEDDEGNWVDDVWIADIYDYTDEIDIKGLRIEGIGYNLIDCSGNMLIDWWAESNFNFVNGYTKVYVDSDGYLIMDDTGKWIISDIFEDFPAFDGFENGYSLCKDWDKGYNFINNKGEYVSDKWYTSMRQLSKTIYKGNETIRKPASYIATDENGNEFILDASGKIKERK